MSNVSRLVHADILITSRILIAIQVIYVQKVTRGAISNRKSRSWCQRHRTFFFDAFLVTVLLDIAMAVLTVAITLVLYRGARSSNLGHVYGGLLVEYGL